MISLWRGLLELAIPRRCAECSVALEPHQIPLCARCADELPWLGSETCVLCQEVIVSESGQRCPACCATPSALSACIASTAYRGATEDWIQRFKYPSAGIGGLDPRPRAVVTCLVRDAAERISNAPDLVVPIPLHPSRLRQRGFNPAAVLAGEVARVVGSRHAPTALSRMRDTPSQTGLDRKQRRRNVDGAFHCQRRLPQRVWLVDDVVTTGATLNEAARALRRAGARDVHAICAARTPAPR